MFLLFAFLENTPYLFDPKLVSQLRASGKVFGLTDWGWNDHYIWWLFSGVVVTVLAGFLAGAIARERGARVAAIANIPSILVWAGFFYLMAYSGVEWEGQKGFQVVSLIAIPLTTLFAYASGGFGAEAQESDFDDETVLGIRPYHWAWIVWPLYLYGVGIVYVAVKFPALFLNRGLQIRLTGTHMAEAFIDLLLALISLIAWIMPLIVAYRILSGKHLSDKHPLVKALANTGILIGGALIATAVQIGCFWSLQHSDL